MKSLPIILIILILSGCQWEGKTNEVEIINNLSFPHWIQGVWQNMSEKDRDKSFSCTFADNKLKIRHGLNFGKSENVLNADEDYVVEENSSDSTYLIELTNGNSSTVHRFDLHSFPWSTKPVILYSISENGKPKEIQLDVVQLILDKN